MKILDIISDAIEFEKAKKRYDGDERLAKAFVKELRRIQNMTDEEREEMERDYENPEYLYAFNFGYYDEEVPPGCAACGGPYPDCTSSCKLFDD